MLRMEHVVVVSRILNLTGTSGGPIVYPLKFLEGEGYSMNVGG